MGFQKLFRCLGFLIYLFCEVRDRVGGVQGYFCLRCFDWMSEVFKGYGLREIVFCVDEKRELYFLGVVILVQDFSLVGKVQFGL